MLTDPRQMTYQAHRKWMREMWAIADAEDWCARKVLTPGDYKPVDEVVIMPVDPDPATLHPRDDTDETH